jgi:hypothetical protein
MTIDLSHPGLDVRQKKKIITSKLHLVSWLGHNESNYEWVWASLKSEKEINLFIKWISEKPIIYLNNVIMFDSQWIETSTFIASNAVDIGSAFKTTGASFAISNDMQWIIEYSTVSTARFGIWNN